MLQIPFYIAILVSIPEILMVYILGLNLLNIKGVDLKKLIIISCIHGVFAYFIRQLSIPFGVHTLIQAIEAVILLKFFGKLNFFQSTASVLAGFFVVILVQLVTIPIFNTIGIDALALSEQPHSIILVSLPALFISLSLIWAIKKGGFYLIDLSRR